MMSKATHTEPRNMEADELAADRLEQFVRGWFNLFAGVSECANTGGTGDKSRSPDMRAPFQLAAD
jgi:hypothetical protein